jgi:hypothetical protein
VSPGAFSFRVCGAQQQTSSKRTSLCDCRCKAEAVQTLSHVLQVEVAVDLGGDLRVRVPEDPLHGRERDPGLEEQRRGRVPEVVEAERLRLGHRPEAHAALRAPARLGVRVALGVAAALPAAAVRVAIHDAGAGERAAENVLQLHVRRVLLAVVAREQDVFTRFATTACSRRTRR